jgi:hypothetical protein
VVAIQQSNCSSCAKHVVIGVRSEQKDGLVVQIFQPGLLTIDCDQSNQKRTNKDKRVPHGHLSGAKQAIVARKR